MERTNAQPHVVIVGGGISGLAAAFFLRDEAVRVTVLEGSSRLGGKLSVSEIGGVAVDEGAEALLVTRPEGITLIAEAGLNDQRTVAGPHVVRDMDTGCAEAATAAAVYGRAVRYDRTSQVRRAVRRRRGPG